MNRLNKKYNHNHMISLKAFPWHFLKQLSFFGLLGLHSSVFAAVPAHLHLDTSDFLSSTAHPRFELPILGDTTQLLSYTTGVSTSGDQNLYLKVNSVTFYASTDTDLDACSGTYRTLDLSSNTWWNSGLEFDADRGEDDNIGSLRLHTAAIDAAATALGYTVTAGSCVQVQVIYKNGDTNTTVGSYIVDTSANSVKDAPFELGELAVTGGVITEGTIENSSGTVSINNLGNFSFSLNGGTTSSLNSILLAGTASTVTVTNLGYGTLSDIGVSISTPFSAAFGSPGGYCQNNTTDLNGQASCTINYLSSNTVPGSGAVILSNANAQQSPAIFPFTVRQAAGVKCWGDNFNGQLGYGYSPTNQSSPVNVCAVGASAPCSGSNLLSNIVTTAEGSNYTCALTTSGGVDCWGGDGSGQLGNGPTLTGNQTIPTIVCAGGSTPCTSNLSSITAISGGSLHVCALTSGGGVKCWGSNSSGQLGNGTQSSSSSPVSVCAGGVSSPCATDLSGIVQIAAGGTHTCALTSSGGVKCWGNNSSGQLGNGTTTNSLTPVTVSGLSSGVVSIARGTQSTCALTIGGGVKCWGANSSGQLGNGTKTSSSTPVDVTGLSSGIVSIARSGNAVCALTSSGGVKCWGENSDGQLGDGTKTDRTTPVNVCAVGSVSPCTGNLLSDIVMITEGSSSTCALTSSGAVDCWGSDSSGELGNGTTTTTTQLYPISSDLTSGAKDISAGTAHVCAIA